MIRRTLFTGAFLICAFLGGAAAQMMGGTVVTAVLATALSSWIGQAAIAVPTWVSSVYGFNGTATTNPAQTPFFSVSTNGQWGGIFATRSSDFTGGGYTSGLNTLCEMDNATTATGVWCQYLQGMFPATAKTGAQLIGTENSLSNQNAAVITTMDPFTPNVGGSTINLRLDCGVGAPGPTPHNNCTNALNIINNAAKYSSPAIIIGDGAMDTSVLTNPPTIAMPSYDAVAWYSAAGVIGGSIFTGAGSPAGVVSCTNRCLYIRTDGGAGTTLYVNETGGGTAGWAAK